MLQYFTIILTVFCCCAFTKSYSSNNGFVINGEVSDSSEISELHLYKFYNMYYEELVAKIPVTDNKFYYSADLEEVDAYVLRNPTNRVSFLFVWDGTINILINEVNFSYSTILNSPLTKELRVFDSTRIAKFIAPVQRLDALVDSALKSKHSNADSLRKVRDEVYTICRKGFDSYTGEYIRNYPDSFIGLLKLTDVDWTPESDEEKKLIYVLSDRLRKHSRAKAFR